jgi:hypothetical protein
MWLEDYQRCLFLKEWFVYRSRFSRQKCLPV